jgi:hypothetical protein
MFLNSRLVLALALLVFRIDANHAHHAFAVDDLALVTDFLYRRSYFHKPALSCRLSAVSKNFGLVKTSGK